VVHDVQGLAPGVYHHAVEDHCLEQLGTGDHRAELQEVTLDQELAADAAVVFVWSAVFGRAAWEYGARAYRYVYLDAGHAAQNLFLAATALGLAACPVGAFTDTRLDGIIGVDGRTESAIYLMAVGRHPAQDVP
jgi:SagB-type dehydrogenase family enzyme